MGFEDIPEDRDESYACKCGGEITKDKERPGWWVCSECGWEASPDETC